MNKLFLSCDFLQPWKEDVPVIRNAVHHKTALATFIIERVPIGSVSCISIYKLTITIQAHKGVCSMKCKIIYLFYVVNNVIEDLICMFY